MTNGRGAQTGWFRHAGPVAKYKIGWLPGDGIGVDVLAAARIVLDKTGLDAEYIPGDIGWEFWCREGDALPALALYPCPSSCPHLYVLDDNFPVPV